MIVFFSINLFHVNVSPHIETSKLICIALVSIWGGTLAWKRLKFSMLDVCVSPCYESTRSSYQRCFLRKGVLRKDPEARSFIKKEALKQIFTFEFFEISKNTFFREHLWETASTLPIYRKHLWLIFSRK